MDDSPTDMLFIHLPSYLLADCVNTVGDINGGAVYYRPLANETCNAARSVIPPILTLLPLLLLLVLLPVLLPILLVFLSKTFACTSSLY